MEPLGWVILAAYSLMCGVGCAVIATSKNRRDIGWFLFGVVFGIVGVLTAIGVTPLPEPEHAA